MTKKTGRSQHKEFLDHYDAYKDKIYRYVYKRVGANKELAEDITSDIFAKAYEKFHLYDKTYAFSTWIYTIARNRVIDHLRKPYSYASDELDMIPQENTFLSELDSSIDLLRVKKALVTLPVTQRDCVEMRYFQDMDTSDIARHKNMKSSAVRKNISRGIQKLRNSLMGLAPVINLSSQFPWN